MNAREHIERKLTSWYLAHRRGSVRTTILRPHHFSTPRRRQHWVAATENPDATPLGLGMTEDEASAYLTIYVADAEVAPLERELIRLWQLEQLRVVLRELSDREFATAAEGVGSVRRAVGEIEAGGPPAAQTHREAGLSAMREFLGNLTVERRTIPTPFAFINREYGGWIRGKLHLVGAITSGHKTTLARMACWHAAKSEYESLFWPMEDETVDMVGRTFAAETKRADTRTLYTVRRPTVDEQGDFQAMLEEIEEHLMSDSSERIRYIDEPTPTLSRVLGAVAAEHARRPFDLLGLDYMQLIEPDEHPAPLEHLHLARVGSQLRALAQQLNIAIVCTVQPKQDATKLHETTGTPIRKGDLRGGSSIGQNAWAILLLNRPWDPQGKKLIKNKIILDIVKWKSGDAGRSETLGVLPHKDLIVEDPSHRRTERHA